MSETAITEPNTGRPADHASMSRLMMRPPGPLPGTDDNGMFCWAAMLRASGLALRRPPSPSAAWAPAGGGLGAGCGAACGAGAGCGATGAAGACAAGSARGAGGGGGEAWGAAAGAAAAPPAEATIAEMSSSGFAITPIRLPTGALPPAGTRILRRTPAPRASISMLALSVSISASTSPTFTGSPSFLLHLTMVPSSMVGESLARTTFVTVILFELGGAAPHPPAPPLAPRE